MATAASSSSSATVGGAHPELESFVESRVTPSKPDPRAILELLVGESLATSLTDREVQALFSEEGLTLIQGDEPWTIRLSTLGKADRLFAQVFSASYAGSTYLESMGNELVHTGAGRNRLIHVVRNRQTSESDVETSDELVFAREKTSEKFEELLKDGARSWDHSSVQPSFSLSEKITTPPRSLISNLSPQARSLPQLIEASIQEMEADESAAAAALTAAASSAGGTSTSETEADEPTALAAAASTARATPPPVVETDEPAAVAAPAAQPRLSFLGLSYYTFTLLLTLMVSISTYGALFTEKGSDTHERTFASYHAPLITFSLILRALEYTFGAPSVLK